MDSLIIVEVLKYVHYVLNTHLPYKWDFCRLPFEENIRLYINTGSYFIAYAAFIFWFTKHVLCELKSLAVETIGNRQWGLTIVLSVSSAKHVLWPAFLTSTYFLTGSFYPWFLSIIVLLLNVRFFILSLIACIASKSEELIQIEFARWKISAESEVESETSSDLSTPSSESSGSDSSDYFSFPDSSEDIEEDKSVNSEDELIKSASAMPVIDRDLPSDVDRETFLIPAEKKHNSEEYVRSPITYFDSSDTIRDLLETLLPLDSPLGPLDSDNLTGELIQPEENSYEKALIKEKKPKKERRCIIV